MTDETERNRLHAAERKVVRAAREEMMQTKTKTGGLLMVHTGAGKGKTTAGFGMVARALGWGMQVGVVQYIKGKWITGERRFFARFPDQVRFEIMGEGFTWDTQDRARDVAAAEAAWAKSLEMIADPKLDFVLLDELNVALRYDYLDLDTVVAALKDRPRDKHVCVTGRDAKPELMEIAELVTEMSLVKHPFQQGIKAQRGVDFDFFPFLDPWRTLAALVLEAAVGYPDRLHRLIPHPVTWAGRGISALEQSWNRPDWPAAIRRLLGVVTLVLIAGSAALAGLLIDFLLPNSLLFALITALLATTGLAQRSLYTHVAAVSTALEQDDLPRARQAVSKIVGRDVSALDRTKIAAAALESLAESFCDGVIAPAFWLLTCGLAGLFAYKAINTADSLIGHREPRWRAFGWASARTDDLFNLIPARLAGCLLAAVSGGGWRVMWRDARKHNSPNAGWPEAAMAGGLKIRLGGPVAYDGAPHPRPWFGDGALPDAAALRRGLGVYLRACFLFWILLAAGGLTWRH